LVTSLSSSGFSDDSLLVFLLLLCSVSISFAPLPAALRFECFRGLC
jgi:hypothetical protein